MTLPLLVLGGVAMWRSSHAPLLSRRGFSSSSLPLHVEYSPFESIELSPFDVSRGYSWKVSTQVQLVGKSPVPASWKTQIQGIADKTGKWLIYRRGNKWKIASPSANESTCVAVTFRLDGGYTLLVDLRTVPRDAEEVRLRGVFTREQWYTGPIPKGWRPPASIKIAGPNRMLTLESKPFDVPIKRVGEPFPSPVVSRTVPFELVDAKWIVDQGQNNFILQARRTDGQKWDSASLSMRDVRILDENARPMSIGSSNSIWFNQEQLNPQRANTDLFVPFVLPDAAHDQAYQIKAKGPLTLRARVSDGKCWPLNIDVRVPRVEMKLSDFGAPSANR